MVEWTCAVRMASSKTSENSPIPKAGASTTRADRFSTEAETNEPSQVSISYSKMNMNVSTAPSITSDDGKRYFCYIDDDANVQVMTYQDVLDSIVRPVIDAVPLVRASLIVIVELPNSNWLSLAQHVASLYLVFNGI